MLISVIKITLCNFYSLAPCYVSKLIIILDTLSIVIRSADSNQQVATIKGLIDPDADHVFLIIDKLAMQSNQRDERVFSQAFPLSQIIKIGSVLYDCMRNANAICYGKPSLSPRTTKKVERYRVFDLPRLLTDHATDACKKDKIVKNKVWETYTSIGSNCLLFSYR